MKTQLKVGQRVGRWTLVSSDKPIGGRTRWLCRCACGAESVVLSQSLKNGRSRSCGCLQSDLAVAFISHGHNRRQVRSPEYSSWANMIRRCTNPNAKGYRYYGGRGVCVCARWKSFPKFLADMGHRPEETSLDRYPNPNGDYEPGNCRWATRREQRVNQVRPSAVAA